MLLMVAVIAVFGLSVLGVALAVSRQRKRGMMSSDENEEDVEYSRLMSKSVPDE